MFRASIAAGVAVIGLALLVADRGFSQQDKTEPAPKVKGQLPKLWSKIGLSDEQKQKVFATRATFGAKIDDLKLKIKRLQSEEKAELEKILTDDQKTALRRLLLEQGPKAAPPAVPDGKKAESK